MCRSSVNVCYHWMWRCLAAKYVRARTVIAPHSGQNTAYRSAVIRVLGLCRVASYSGCACVLCWSQSTRVLQRRDFWLVFIANVAGIGGGVFIVSSVQQVWANFATPNLLHWGRHIIVMFSVCTAIANVISPMAADYLHQRGKLQRAHFAGFILAFVCTNYVVLGLCTALPSIRNGGGTAVAVLYMCLMALVGVGFGSSLTLFPTLLSEVYGLKNFGCVPSW